MNSSISLRLLVSWFFIFWSAVASAQSTDLLLPEQAFRFTVERGPGEETTLRWDIEKGYYLYREHLTAKDAGTGVSLALETEPGIVLSDDPNFGPSEVYYSQAIARLGKTAPAQVAITYQGCKKDSICYPPMTLTLDTKTLKLSEAVVGYGPTAQSEGKATPDSAKEGGFRIAEDTQGGGMIGSLLATGGAPWVIASFLVFGLLLAFTPCVLPMYPILSATLAREGEALTARRGFVLSSAYVLAMAMAFGLLGIVAALSGQNLQIVLQSPYAVGAVGFLFVILAISMFGFFELGLPSAWVTRLAGVKTGARGSIGGAAAMGFVSALIVGPCVTAPLAAGLLYIAQTGDVWLGASALFALGLGQGIPLVAFGTIGSRAVPRTGAWMVQVKYLFGFVFLGAAIWMTSRIIPAQATLALWALLLLTAAVFIGVADRLPDNDDAGPRLRKAIGLALSLGGVIFAVGAASGATDPLRPLAHFTGGGMQQPVTELTFTEAGSAPDLEEKLAAASGKPTLVYFTADWCVTCGTIERDVLPDPTVIAGLDGFQRVKIDLTKLDDSNQTLMRDLAVVGPPTMIFFNRSGSEVGGSRLIGDVTRASLTDSISRVGQ